MEKQKANGVEYYQDWDRSEGGIVITNPKTVKRYWELKEEHPDGDKYGVFFAFDKKQFEEGIQELIRKGYIKEGDKVASAGAGMYGTKEEIHRYFDFYDERGKRIAEECDPQEVYFTEWNNHECMFGDDDSAFKIVVSYFGNEAARKIVRLYEGTPTNILAPLTDRDKHLGEYSHTLTMLGRLEFDCQGFFSKNDCRYHRPDCLWAAGGVKRQVEEMRKLFNQLPDDIKDASCMSHEQIEEYARQFEAWSDEEFAMPKYDPVPETPYEKYHGLELEIGEKLYYQDDDGKWQTPTTVWFSSDLRRWHQDAKMVHGRAMTAYGGKNGTTLAPVYFSNARTLTLEPYRRDDLCNVSCSYEYKPLHSRLYNFYRE